MSLRHAILGFLATRPMSGYDLRRALTTSAVHVWPADQAQIYRTLAALVAEGLVDVETEAQEHRPNRRVHSIRAQGVADLDAWLAAPLEQAPVRDPFLLRLYLGGRLGVGPMRALLTVRIGQTKGQIDALTGLAAAMRAAETTTLEARLRLAIVDHGLAHARAERDWAQALYDELGKPGVREPGAETFM